MMNTNEKMVPSVKEEEEEIAEEDEEEEIDEEGDTDEEEEATSSDDEAEEEQEENAGGAEKKTEPRSAGEKQKPSDVLNLNNEVVKMRKEVRRIRALIIRKLTRQIAALKKKKGNEAETERNQRRAARLLEEVHCLKKLPPDMVTKTALQKNLNFEHVCKNPKSTISDRAVARVATHPQFSKKIESIKAAVKNFKEERVKAGNLGGCPKSQRQPGNATQLSPDARQDRGNKDSPVKQQPDESEEGAEVLKRAKKSGTREKQAPSPAITDVHKQKKPDLANVKSASVKRCAAKGSTKPTLQSKHDENSCRLQPEPELDRSGAEEQESDVESSDDEEKEYFDDSTEERFHKLSSQSDESDEDDFFVGKVSRFKKKKKKETSSESGEKLDRQQKGGKDSGSPKTDKLQRELDELESRLKSKVPAARSVFYSSLAGAKGGHRGDKGKGAFKSGAPGDSKADTGLAGGVGQLNRFTKQDSRNFNSGSRFSKPPHDRRREAGGSRFSKPPHDRRREAGGAGREGGKDVRKQKDQKKRGFFSQQPPQPALHPSWEASKKRKEQQGQILAFQGKKIKFDDDDDE